LSASSAAFLVGNEDLAREWDAGKVVAAFGAVCLLDLFELLWTVFMATGLLSGDLATVISSSEKENPIVNLSVFELLIIFLQIGEIFFTEPSF
jgi:hypothetical protein